jgi:hypothetical protein
MGSRSMNRAVQQTAMNTAKLLAGTFMSFIPLLHFTDVQSLS